MTERGTGGAGQAESKSKDKAADAHRTKMKAALDKIKRRDAELLKRLAK